MNYALAKELKDAGFPKSTPRFSDEFGRGQYTDDVYYPTLSELIESCGEKFESLRLEMGDGTGLFWRAHSSLSRADGKTPEEAVARLWLALNK